MGCVFMSTDWVSGVERLVFWGFLREFNYLLGGMEFGGLWML